MVARLGPARALGWYGWNLPRYDHALAEFGPVRTHLLATTISLLSNSERFVRTQGAALRQSYFQEHGRPFPLGEPQLIQLCGQSPALIRHRMLDAAQQAGLHADVPWLSRTVTLATTPEPCPVDREDLRVVHLVRMFRTLTEFADGEALMPV